MCADCVFLRPRIQELMEHVIKPVVPEKYLDEQTIFHLNPSGGSLYGGLDSGRGARAWGVCSVCQRLVVVVVVVGIHKR